jgi:type IV pilus assembly protein PilB
MSSKKRLGELLLEAGVIDETQLQSALGHQRRWGGRIGQALLDLKLVSEAAVVEALSRKSGIEVAHLGELEPYALEQALKLVPKEFAQRNNIFPMAADTSTITVAMSDPSNLALADELRFRSGRRVKVCIGGDREVAEAIRLHYQLESSPTEPIPFDSEPTGDVPLAEPFEGGSTEAMRAMLEPTRFSEPGLARHPPEPFEPMRPTFSPVPGTQSTIAPVEPFHEVERPAQPAPPAAPRAAAPLPPAVTAAAPRPPAPIPAPLPRPAPPPPPRPPPAAAPAPAPAPTQAPVVRGPALTQPSMAAASRPAPAPAAPRPPAPAPAVPARPAPTDDALLGAIPRGGFAKGVAPEEHIEELSLADEIEAPPPSAAPPAAPRSAGAGAGQAAGPAVAAAEARSHEAAVLEALGRLAAGGADPTATLPPGRLLAVLLRLLVQKKVIGEQELLDELMRR